jgi:methyl halide transferase
MTMNKFDKNFWETLYKEDKTGWNIGHPSTPIKTYIDQLKNKNLKILIPGAGNGYEAEYLHKKGFTNVWLIDLAKKPLENFKKRVPDFPETHLIQGDFFDHSSQYDIIIEQTFFCALDPLLRHAYAKKMSQLLKSGGKLVGLLFNFELTSEGPPFGGSEKEYQKLFSKYFKIKVLEAAYNSIKPRNGREFFIIFEKLI